MRGQAYIINMASNILTGLAYLKNHIVIWIQKWIITFYKTVWQRMWYHIFQCGISASSWSHPVIEVNVCEKLKNLVSD